MKLLLSYEGNIIGGENNLPRLRKESLTHVRQLDGYRCPACGKSAKGLSGFVGATAHFMWRCTGCDLTFRCTEEKKLATLWYNPLEEFENNAYKKLLSNFLEYQEKKALPGGK